MTTAATAPATFELDEALKARILDLAGRRKTGPLEIVREALAHLEREEDEDEAFYQEALQAERDYQETGLRITGEEAIDRNRASSFMTPGSGLSCVHARL